MQVPPTAVRAGTRRLLVLGLAVLIAVSACAQETEPASNASIGAPARPAPAIDEAPTRPTGPTQEGTLVRVVDGDTLRVLVDGVEERVRYIGMDTPELNATSTATPDPYSEAATAANARLLVEGHLVLEKDVSERDRYGRLLRDVWVEDDGTWMLVNLALVAEGFAQVSTYPPDVKYADDLLAAEADARAAGSGLWGEPAP
jgi:micrococcal nuclease